MSQIKSKKRVKELAEVYTNKREVNAMLDLVKEYSYDITKRFLEPACGNGNFLIKILERKISIVKSEVDIYISLSNIYGVDICQENVKESKERLFNYILKEFPKINKELVLFILDKNIICGNTLDDNLIFTEFIYDEDRFILYEYTLEELYKDKPKYFSKRYKKIHLE